MFVILLFFIFVNCGNGAMIHASEHSEIPANISITNSFTHIDRYGQVLPNYGYGVSITTWSSARLCGKNKTVQFLFDISTSQSTCQFVVDQTPQLLTLSSRISGNIQWQRYQFVKNDISVDDDVLLNITIFNDGHIEIFNHSTELRCYARMFENEDTLSIKAKETSRCRFAVLVQGMEKDVNYDISDPNILHNYYIDTYTLIAIFSVLCGIILALDFAHTIYFCYTQNFILYKIS